MSREIISIDLDYIKELYVSGKTVQQIAAIIGISKACLEKKVRIVGFRFSDLRKPRRTIPYVSNLVLPADEIIAMYKSGITKTAIAAHFNVAQSTIGKFMARIGYPTAKNRKEAALIHNSRLSQEQRQKNSKLAHDAVRGSKRTIADLESRAKGVEKMSNIVSRYEIEFAKFLNDSHYEFIPQKAIGIYNCDFTIDSIVVEIFGGCFHAYGKHVARLYERMRYILDGGFNIYIIWAYSGEKSFSPAVFNDFITFNEQSRSNPSFRGQYRVVWGDGEFISCGCNNTNDFTNVIPTTLRLHSPRNNRRT